MFSVIAIIDCEICGYRRVSLTALPAKDLTGYLQLTRAQMAREAGPCHDFGTHVWRTTTFKKVATGNCDCSICRGGQDRARPRWRDEQ